MTAAGEYHLPQELVPHAPQRGSFTPDELREVCRLAGKELGREDAARGEFRAAAQMVSLWQGLDLPAWEAPYILRNARLGYLSGFDEALFSGGLDQQTILRAATARWGERWYERLEALRTRQSEAKGP